MTITTKALFAAGIVSLLGFATANVANAHDRDRRRDWYRTSAGADNSRRVEFPRDRADWRRDWQRSAARNENSSVGELRRDQVELRRDLAELERDRADLQRLNRSGASWQAIDRKRQEIRDDLKELAQDHREIGDSLEALSNNQNRGLGRERINSTQDRWGRYDNNGWGWGRDRRNDPVGWGLSDLFGWRVGRD